MLGYTDNKSKLQTEINDYIENGENENTALYKLIIYQSIIFVY